MTDLNNISDERSTTLLPDDFVNEMFQRNITYLKANQPALFNAVIGHECKEYWLSSNHDGSPNIVHLASKSPVYYASTMEEIMAPVQQQIDNLFCYAHLNKTFLGEGDPFWVNNSPIQVEMMAALYDAGIFGEMKLSSESVTALDGYCTDYLPMVRVYGIGLGYHLTELIKQKKISFMTIYEPSFDLFYISLFTVPWDLIFKYFEYNNKGINLILDASAEMAIQSNTAFMEQRLTPMTQLFYRFNHFNSLPAIQEIIKKEPDGEFLHAVNVDSGSYEDQRIGFYFSAKNIQKKNKFFSGRKTQHFCRIFVVGSGPSLNESIDYIKAHQEDALIFSCGSAITPLLAAGITPDYELVQERVWHIPEHEQRHNMDSIKKITLLKLNVVSTKLDSFYKEALVFQKYKDPGSFLLKEYQVTSEVNPTVTNAGVSFAADLGADEVYLFGVDYGAPKGSARMHASNTCYDDVDHDDGVTVVTSLDREGNLGAVIRTTSVLSWSLDVTKLRISRHPEIAWVNVGEGALIAGATPMAVENLPKRFKKKLKKKRSLQDVSACFNNNYSFEDIYSQLTNEYLQEVEEYFQAILEFTKANPQTREEITSVLSAMYKAAAIGIDKTDFLPALLLSSGVKQFVAIVYTQNGLYAEDDLAVIFFEKAKKIFRDYMDDINADLRMIIGFLEIEEELDLVKEG